MQNIRAYSIVFVFLTLTLMGIPYQSAAMKFNWKSRKTFPHRYHKFMTRLFGIRVTTIGRPVTDEGVLEMRCPFPVRGEEGPHQLVRTATWQRRT